MRQIITLADLKGDRDRIVGKWVVQLNEENPEVDFTAQTSNDGFWLEKRISYVGQLDLIGNKEFLKEEHTKEGLIVLNGLYYCHGIFTKEQFVAYFNTCSPTYDEKREAGKGRFYRLLTSRELDWLNGRLKAAR